MPSPSEESRNPVDDRIAQLEARIARLEDYVGLTESDALRAGAREMMRPLPKSADELEQEVGENWFGRAGIIALAVAGAFMLTLPYPALPAAVPSVAGYVGSAALFAIAHQGRHSFSLVASYLRGAAMALLFCATLRLFYFGQRPAFPANGVTGTLVLIGVAAVNVLIAWHRRSPWLMILALCIAAATPLALGSPWTVLPACCALAIVVAFVGSRPGWRALLPVGIGLTFATYLGWAIGNPVIGGGYHWAVTPFTAPLFVLLYVAVFGSIPLWSRSARADELPVAFAALLNCVFGYGLFLVHTYAIHASHFALLHVIASSVYLWLAAALWLRHRSQIATFFYAMCGYAALSMAIVHATRMPDVLVWLSVESVVVVATAIWFQSRFIVVANFIIYVLVVLGYMIMNERETGVSIGFGAVALVSARVLNWQRHRLELKTELMRNAYLLSAFVVFPYALFHLAPSGFAGLAWIGLAVLYYTLNLVIRNQKYRWMGHATLLLTSVYLLLPGQPGFTTERRVLSLLALGAVLVLVSLVFTRLHRRRREPAATLDAAAVLGKGSRDP